MNERMKEAQTEFNVMMRVINEQIKKLTSDFISDYPEVDTYTYSFAATFPSVKSKGFIMGGNLDTEAEGLAHLAMAHRSGVNAVLGEEQSEKIIRG